MSILNILIVLAVVYVCYKIGATALKWMLLLAALIAAYWFFTSGGGVEIKKPSNMPELPKSVLAPIR